MTMPGNLHSALFMKPIISPIGHRYWRLHMPQSGYVAVAEVEFRTLATGAVTVNQTCTGGNAIASSHYSIYSPNGAFNGVLAGRGWASNSTPVPQWIGYDFGAGQQKHIVEVALSGCDTPSQNIKQANVQYSDNGTTWITVYSTPTNLVLTETRFNVYPIQY